MSTFSMPQPGALFRTTMGMTMATSMRNRAAAKNTFDAAYYRRFYRDARTRVASREELRLQATFAATFIRRLDIPVKKILDAGCGLGLMRAPLLRAFPEAKYLGVEVSEYLCQRYGWTHASLSEFNTHERFDVVICLDVVQYFDDRTAACVLENLARWCRGALYFFVPTTEDWDDGVDQQVSDTNVYVRSAQWYRQRLRKHFRHLGQGLLLKRDVPVVQWAIQEPWQ
jgi:SAM-dependent methyltransferase